MTKNVEIVSNGSESSTNLLKRFSQKIRSSGIIQRAKSIRYAERKMSDFKKKKEKLRKIKKTQEVERAYKLGKKL